MIGAARSLFDRWRGGGHHAATVPSMDGVLRPNEAIEDAPLLLKADAPDNLVEAAGGVLFSSGGTVMRLDLSGTIVRAESIVAFESAVSAIAAHGEAVAVGLDDGSVRLMGGPHDGKVLKEFGGRQSVCPTALALADADTLILALGSQQNPPSMWRQDLMQKNAIGSVWRCNLVTGETACLADGLAWPSGLLIGRDGRLTVSESWRHRLLELRAGIGPAVTMADIAGYPGRLAPATGGGAWLSVFAPRSQLVEFVLREDDFRISMMKEVEPEFWIAPSLSATQSFLEPMQLGGLKQLGILKPWAPTRSYGLIIGMDDAHEPQASFHSRADGRRHGITSALELDGRLLVTSKGGGAIIAIPLEGPGANA
jgi:hypothetical protein